MSSRGERLQSAMAARGVHKQIVLAAELGVNESAVSRWQQGLGLSLDHAARLCEALDISLDWLVLGRGHMDQHRSPAEDPGKQATLLAIEALPAPVADALGVLLDSIKIELASSR
jgi:transcriptional regulator with XRE-family HTH domain